MPILGFAELTLQTTDRPELERFYTELLGLETIAREDDRTWLSAGRRARLGLWTPGEKEFGDEGGAHVHFALSVDDEVLDAIARRLRGAGRSARGPVTHDGGDRSLYTKDPAGNVVELWSFFAEGGDIAELR